MRPGHLYRVFPWLEAASEGEPGHPHYVHTPQGAGRVDNPEHYVVFYASDLPVGAIGEAFGNHALWTPDLLEGPPLMPGSRRALATYETATINVLDLDDPGSLHERDLRPSRVVTKERSVTQSWALGIYTEDRWDGVRWWSYHYPEWGSFGMWRHDGLKVGEVRPLDSEMGLVMETAALLNRPWED